MKTVKWRTLNVFISSTFLDMQGERDHLVRFVFPVLRQELLKRRVHLREIDLRWGITSEENVIGVCRDIIDDCRPHMICLLGERYGWIPAGRAESITSMEIDYGIGSLARSERQAILVRLWRRIFRRGRPRTGPAPRFYFRDRDSTLSIPGPDLELYREPPGSGAEKKLAKLKRHVVARGFRPFVYEAEWDPRQKRLVRLEEFGERVLRDILANVETELGPAEDTPADPFEEENAHIDAFISGTISRYIPEVNEDMNRLVRRFVSGKRSEGEPGILAIVGEPGSGKSSFLAHSVHDTGTRSPERLIIPHFVGVGRQSTDLGSMLRRLCRELTGTPPDEGLLSEELASEFAKRLQEASRDREVVIFIDALNQLDPTDKAHTLFWLPMQLPRGVSIVVSSIEEHAVRESLDERGQRVEIATLPDLSEKESELIISRVLAQYGKQLTGEQADELLRKSDADQPLYLLAALEELRTLGVHHEITSRIVELPGETESLFRWILEERLANEPGFRQTRETGGALPFVGRFVALLAASRQGLSHEELTRLVEPEAPGDPDGDVAALELFLRPFLMVRGELLDFYHGQFRSAVEKRWLPDAEAATRLHSELADFFATCGYAYPRTGRELPYHRVLGEQWAAFRAMLDDLPLADPEADERLRNGILRTLASRLHLDENDPVREAITRLGEADSQPCADLLVELLNRAFPIGGWIVEHLVRVLEPRIERCTLRNRVSAYLTVHISASSSANYAYRSGYLEKAEELSRHPDAADLRPFILVLLATRHPPELAIEKSGEAIRLAENLPGNSRREKLALWQALFNTGRLFKHQWRYGEAMACFRRAEKVFPPFQEPVNVIWSLEKQIVTSFHLGEFGRAADLLGQVRQHLRFRPEDTLHAKFREQSGWLLIHAGEIDRGLELLEGAIGDHRSRDRREYFRSLCKVINAGIDFDRIAEVESRHRELSGRVTAAKVRLRGLGSPDAGPLGGASPGRPRAGRGLPGQGPRPDRGERPAGRGRGSLLLRGGTGVRPRKPREGIRTGGTGLECLRGIGRGNAPTAGRGAGGDSG